MKTSTCCSCGATWETGTDGSHSCITELQRKLLLARKGLLWIKVRATCDRGEPLADKLADVASSLLECTAVPAIE